MAVTDFMEIDHEHEDAVEAFNALVKEAKYLFGTSGYTGTIAEKSGYYIITCKLLTDEEAEVMATEIFGRDIASCCRKDGPAGGIKLLKGWMFIGSAAS